MTVVKTTATALQLCPKLLPSRFFPPSQHLPRGATTLEIRLFHWRDDREGEGTRPFHVRMTVDLTARHRRRITDGCDAPVVMVGRKLVITTGTECNVAGWVVFIYVIAICGVYALLGDVLWYIAIYGDVCGNAVTNGSFTRVSSLS